MTVDDAAAQVGHALLRFRRRDELGDRNHDVARMVFGDDLFAFAAALVDHLDDVEAVRPADDLRDLARRERVGDLHERFWQGIDRAPLQIAAVERVLRVGVADRRGGEIEAAVDLLLHVVGFVLGRLDLVGARVLGRGDQDVGEMDFAGLDVAGREQGVDFGVADLACALHDALLQALDENLFLGLLAEIVIVQTVARERAAQLGDVDVVALRDALDRLVDVVVGDADAGALRALNLDAIHDQAVEHLAAQDVGRGQLLRIAAVLGLDLRDGAVELALQNDVVLGDRDDAVERFDRLDLGACERHGDGKEQGEEGGEKLVHRQLDIIGRNATTGAMAPARETGR